MQLPHMDSFRCMESCILLQQEDQLVTGVVHGMQADRNLDSEEGEACSGQKAHVLEALQSEMNSVTVRHVS